MGVRSIGTHLVRLDETDRLDASQRLRLTYGLQQLLKLAQLDRDANKHAHRYQYERRVDGGRVESRQHGVLRYYESGILEMSRDSRNL